MNRLPLFLTIASILPFVALAIAVSQGGFGGGSGAVEILLTYAAVILSFLGGIHWGVAVTQYSGRPRIANLLVVESVAPALGAWFSLFYCSVHIQLLVLTLLYTFVWAIDSLLYNNDIIPYWFFALRCIVTPIVVVSLYVAYFGLI